ncbi:MAG: hypothetical protein EOP04_15040 [Proteobacteria bacterium]|nr:MAG: hypothetical protein EOP04_15040 [Pseudomonadota bacterium]
MEDTPQFSEEQIKKFEWESSRYKRWEDGYLKHRNLLREKLGIPDTDTFRFLSALTEPLLNLSSGMRDRSGVCEPADYLMEELPRVADLFANEVANSTAFSVKLHNAVQAKRDADSAYQMAFVETVQVIMQSEGIDLLALKLKPGERPFNKFGAPHYGDYGLAFAKEANKYWDKWTQTERHKEVFEKTLEARYSLEKEVFEWLRKTLPENDRIKGLLPKKKKEKADTPAVDDSNLIALVPNTNANWDIFRSLSIFPLGWELNKNVNYYGFDGEYGHTVTYSDSSSDAQEMWDNAPDEALRLLEEKFFQMKNELIPDIIQILFYKWYRERNKTTLSAVVTAADLCRYRGKVPKGDNLELHWEALKDTFKIGLRSQTSDISGSVFFAETYNVKSGPGASYAYTPGHFLRHIAMGGKEYWSPAMQRLWALDPTRNGEAKRIGRWMQRHWRNNMGDYVSLEGEAKADSYQTIASLLNYSGIMTDSHKQGINPGRAITKFTRAIETLYDNEIIAQSGDNIYHPKELRYARKLVKGDSEVRINRLENWLALRVCLQPAADLREAYVPILKQSNSAKARDAAALSTERAKEKIRAEKRALKK